MSELSPPVFNLSKSQPWYKKTRTRWTVVAVLVVLIAVIWRCGKSDSADIRISDQAIVRFHQQFNAGAFEDIYDDASDQLRSSTTKDEWLKLLSAVQRKLGGFVRADGNTYYNITTNFNKTFVTITVQTEFARGTGKERFTWSVAGNDAILISYNIDSRDLIVK
jgi:hypothetical protein